MLKVKKKIPSTKNKNKNEDVTQLHEEIKNSIKNLYLSDQKRKKQLMNILKFYPKLEMNTLYHKKKITSLKFNYKNIKTMLKIYLRNHIQNIKNR